MPKKAPKQPKPANPCLGASLEEVTVPDTNWAAPLPWKPSIKGLTAYSDFHGHTKVYDRRAKPPKVTFNEKAITALAAKYLGDPIYSALDEYREVQMCRGTFVDSILKFIRPNGRICGTFGHTPITLRLSQKDPSLLNLPRIDSEDKESVYNYVRALYVAAPGKVILARDFMGIEAKIVGWLANARDYVRICGIDAHSFYVSHNVGEPADMAWDDATLLAYLKGIKKRFPAKRQAGKKVQHAGNYLATAHKLFIEEPKLFGSEREAKRQMELYYGLFPQIPAWHSRTVDEADKYGYVTAPTGFRLHYADVYDLKYLKGEGRWERTFSDRAKEAVAGVPQHVGGYILFNAAVTLCEEYPEFADLLRLLIHDEIMIEVDEDQADLWNARMKEVMERPIKCMPMPESWGMGEYLTVGTEGKRTIVSREGQWGRWSEMKETA